MKLWLLIPIDPATVRYECMHGFVIRAESAALARELAREQGAMETWEYPKFWIDPAITSCEELTAEGPEEIVIMDMLHG